MNLYQISDQYMQALNELMQLEDMPYEYIKDTLAGIEGEFRDKAVNVAAYSKSLLAEADAIEAAVINMSDRAKKLKSRSLKLKEYLKSSMEFMGIQSIKSDWFDMKIAKNPPKLVIENEAAIPPEYWTEVIETSLDKVAIRQFLKAGNEIRGAFLAQETRLDIK